MVQSILAAEVGYQDLAREYFQESLFVDLGDLHQNAADGVHVASAGGVWTALVSGFGGMRDHGGELSFDPRLPADWPELSFPLQWRGSQLAVTVRKNEILVEVVEGDAVAFTVRGIACTARVGAPAAVALTHQGPRIPGRPRIADFAHARRDDGTLMSASLPVTTTSLPILGEF